MSKDVRTCLSISPPIRCHLKGSARYLFFPEVLGSSGIGGLLYMMCTEGNLPQGYYAGA